MIQQVLSHYHLPGLACFGLLLFMGVFTGVLTWVFRHGSKSHYAAMEAIPLLDDPSEGVLK